MAGMHLRSLSKRVLSKSLEIRQLQKVLVTEGQSTAAALLRIG